MFLASTETIATPGLVVDKVTWAKVVGSRARQEERWRSSESDWWWGGAPLGALILQPLTSGHHLDNHSDKIFDKSSNWFSSSHADIDLALSGRDNHSKLGTKGRLRKNVQFSRPGPLKGRGGGIYLSTQLFYQPFFRSVPVSS